MSATGRRRSSAKSAEQAAESSSAVPDPENASSTPYTVLARRYRPQQFEECLGQGHVAQSLKNAIEQDRVAHAYLFTGARGVGKTSMARILAKALNCRNGPTTEPCGTCESCLAIASGDDVDVLEIDGASNRGIDEVRELRQGVQYRPSRSRYKIYIIDEVHMLTKEAFNALLKTLEEPPPHAKFFFATTEPQKIPITILSRCQRFDFSSVDRETIMGRLKEIVEREGKSADDEALEIIARRAGGSMRDSQSLLDQLLAFAGERLTADDVHRLTGSAGEERVAALMDALIRNDAADCLRQVDSAAVAGVQLGEWVDQMLGYFRDLMVLGVDASASTVAVPGRMRPQLLAQAKNLPPERLLERMDLLATCRTRMKAAGHARVLLEMTLVRMCRLDAFLSVVAAMEMPSPLPPPTAAAPPAPASPASAVPMTSDATPPASASASRANPESQAPLSPVKKNEAAEAIVNGAIPPSSVSPGHNAVAANADLGEFVNAEPTCLRETKERAENVEKASTWGVPSAERVQPFWREVLRSLENQVLLGMLERADGVMLSPPAMLVVRFPGQYPAAKRYCEEPNRQANIEACCTRLAGQTMRIRFELGPLAEEDRPRPRASLMELKDQAARDPLVASAIERFRATMTLVEHAPESTVEAADEAEVPEMEDEDENR